MVKVRDLSGTARCGLCKAEAEYPGGVVGTPLVIRHKAGCIEGITNEIQRAKAIIQQEADDTLLRDIARLEAEGKATWVLDPDVVNVVGLVVPKTLRAFVIVYLGDHDFEVDNELIEAYL